MIARSGTGDQPVPPFAPGRCGKQNDEPEIGWSQSAPGCDRREKPVLLSRSGPTRSTNRFAPFLAAVYICRTPQSKRRPVCNDEDAKMNVRSPCNGKIQPAQIGVSATADQCPYCRFEAGELLSMKPHRIFGEAGINVASYKFENCRKEYEKEIKM